MRLLAGTVYDRPPQCDVCRKPEEECTCPRPEPLQTSPGRQTVRVRKEKRKHGRIVTVVTDFSGDYDVKSLLRQLRSLCGAGGTSADQALELQGEHVARVTEFLKSLGIRVRG